MNNFNNSYHAFECNGQYFLYDVESGALHITDRTAYDVLRGQTAGYDEATVREINDEIDQLIATGSLNAPAPEGVDTVKSDVIKSLCLHISHDCNLRCKYCFASQGSYSGQRLNMPLEVGKKAIDFLIEKSGARKNLEVDFFGGEPLLNLDVLKQIVEYADERGHATGKTFLFTTTTNGLLLTDETAEYLNEHMENVVLSIDGRKEVNDAVRLTPNQKGSYDIIVDKFRHFRSIRGKRSYYVRGTFTACNTDFCADVLHLNDLGFDQISVEPVVLPENDPLALKEEHLGEIFSQYELLAKEYVSRRKTEKWFGFFHFFIDLENSPCYKKKIVGCGAGYEYLAVSPEGDIYPCHQFVGDKEWKMGNVLTGEFNQQIRSIFGSTNLTTKDKCRNCWAKYHCSGGCSANAVHFNGDINKPYELSCKIFRKRLECALYVYASEKLSD